MSTIQSTIHLSRTQAGDTIVHFADGLTAVSDVWSVHWGLFQAGPQCVVDMAETVVTVSSRSVGFNPRLYHHVSNKALPN